MQSPLTPAKAPVATTKPNGNDKGKGKGKGVQMTPAVPAPVAGPSTKASGNDGWTTIARRHMPVKPWCLRSEDWGAPVVEHDQMAKSLTEAKGVFKAVVLCTPDQRDTLQELLKGTEKLHAVLCVTLGSGPGAEKCPGTNVGTGKPTFRQAVFTRVHTPGQTVPGPKHKGQKLEKVEEVRFAVLYVKIVQKFVSPDDWQRATQNPQKFFHAWLAKRHLKAMDSWGWQKEHQKGAPAKIFGLCKVHERDALAVLLASGAGCFINPSRSYPMPANKIEWL